MKRWLAVVALAAVLAGCSGGSSGSDRTSGTFTTPTHRHSVTKPTAKPTARPTAKPSLRPLPATTVPGLPPDADPPRGEKERGCPYISTQRAADIEGNRIYRTTVITTTHPVGCRFYFWCCDFHATLDIVPRTFPSATEAYNAMVLTGEAGAHVAGIASLVKGVSAVVYQTKFYGPDGSSDWACTFAKGRVMVTVRTNQNDVSFNAKQLAKAIAPKF